MLYKKPIITLTSLLDLLFILIFAYQMDIKTDAEKYVQAEVSKRVLQKIPDQRELVTKLQEENKRARDELEIVRRKSESIDEYKLQLEEYKEQRDQLRNELQKKERELIAVKLESKSIKTQSKTEGVIPITDKDAELTKALVGTWRGNYNRGPSSRAESVTYYADGRFTSTGTITAIRGFILNPADVYLFAGDSLSYQISGSWWVKGGYRFLLVSESNNTTAWPVGYSVKDHMSFMRNKVRFRRDSDNIQYEFYRFTGH